MQQPEGIPMPDPADEKRKRMMEVTRRHFIELTGTGLMGVAAVGAGAVTYSFMRPDVVREPPRRFPVGKPEQFPDNTATLVRDKRLLVVRNDRRFMAISARCTHLGCLTEWNKELKLIACPCHGSRFDKTGALLTGPATTSLPRWSLELSDENTLVVDTDQVLSRDDPWLEVPV